MRSLEFSIVALLLAITIGVAGAGPSTTLRLPAKPPAAKQIPLVPAPNAVLAMVRSTLLAVDHGNKTGNYTVLRDLAGPQFHDANNASKLVQIFSQLPVQGVDLLAVAVVVPDYKAPPSITAARMLYVVGTFPIRPRPVNFEILYEMSGGQWRVFGISIAPAE